MTKKQNDQSMPVTDEAENKYAHVSAKRSSLALRGAAWSFLNTVVPTILTSIVFIISSRYLMPKDFGVVALVSSFVSLAGAIAPIALGEAIVQYKNVRNYHLDTVFWLCIVSAALIYCLYLIIAPIVAINIHQPELLEFLPILGLKLFFDLSATVSNALITRAMTFHLIAARTIIATFISGVICIGLLLLGYGIWALVISQLATSITSCVAVLIGAKWMPGFAIKASALKDLYRYGLFASGNRFLTTLNLDQIIIGSSIGAAPLGIYNFSKRLFKLLNDAIAGALASVSHSLLSSLQSEKEKVKEAFLMATFGSSIVSFPAFIGLAAIAGEAIPLIFGAQWDDAVEPTRWFCLIGLMSCIGVIQSALINSQGRSDWWFYYVLFKQIFLIFTVVVLRDEGISVIVMAIALQTALFWPITFFMVKKIIEIKLKNYLYQFLAPLTASLIMLITIIAIQYYFKESAVVRLLIEIILGGMVYCATVMALSGKRIWIISNIFLGRNNK